MASTNITTFPGKVGISNANPTHTLAIGSNVYVDDTGSSKLTVTGIISGDGLGISNIQTANVLGLTDNVSRITTVSNDLSDNSSRITTVSNDLSDNSSRITTVSNDLSDNSSRIDSLGDGAHTFTGVKTFQDDIILESNLRVNGSLTYANTVNMIVSDPIIELGANNQHTNDLGLVLTRHGNSGNDSNVAIFYDESQDNLKIGYTDDGASQTTLSTTATGLDVSITGNVAAAYNADETSYFGRAAVGYMGQSDQASFSHLDKNTSTNFALKQAASGATHLNTPTGQHIRFSVNASEVGRFTGGGDFKVGANKLYVDTSASEVQMYSQATGSTAGPDLVLMRNNPNNGGNNEYIGQIRYEGLSDTGNSRLYAKTTGKIKTATNGSEDGVIETMIKTGGSNRISVRHSGDKFLIQKGTDLQVGEVANLYVDTSTSRVGIGTSSPDSIFHTHSGAGADEVWVDQWKHSFDANWNFRLSQRHDHAINVEYGFKQRYNTVEYSPITFRGSTIELSSNVGIGTASPRCMLDIYTASTAIPGLIIDRHSSGTYRSELYQESDGLAIKVGDGTNTPTENMRITSSTTATAGKLTVGTGTASSSQMFVYAEGDGSTTANTDLHVLPNGQIVMYGTRPWITNTNAQGTLDKQCHISLHTSGHMPAFEWVRNTSQGTNQKNWLLRQDTDDGLYLWHYDGSTWTVPFGFNKDGKLGLGTSSPSVQLHIQGTSPRTLSTSNGPSYSDYGQLVITDTTAPSGTTTLGNLKIGYDASTGSFGTGFLQCVNPNVYSGPLVLNPYGGNVGIGLTGPSSKLHIYGSDNPLMLQSYRSPYPKLSYDFSGTNAENFQFYDHHGSGRGFLYGRKYTTGTTPNSLAGWTFYGNDNTVGLRINGSGNVGIGTSNPSHPLHVYKSATWPSFVVRPTSLWGDGLTSASATGGTQYMTVGMTMFQGPHITPWSAGGDAYIRYGRAGGVATGVWWETACRTDGSFHIAKNAALGAGIHISGGGNVGMGASNPIGKLDVITSGSPTSGGNTSAWDTTVVKFGPNSGTTGGALSFGAGLSTTYKTYAVSLAPAVHWCSHSHLAESWYWIYGSTQKMYLANNGNLTIAGSYSPASDDRIKTEEEHITNATDTLLKLKPQKYRKHNFEFIEVSNETYENAEEGSNIFVQGAVSNVWVRKDDLTFDSSSNVWYDRSLSNTYIEEAGLIAQDIWYDAPELRYIVKPSEEAVVNETRGEVSDNPQVDPDYSDWGRDTAHVNYNSLIPYLIKSNQELHGEIQALKARITSLENA